MTRTAIIYVCPLQNLPTCGNAHCLFTPENWEGRKTSAEVEVTNYLEVRVICAGLIEEYQLYGKSVYRMGGIGLEDGIPKQTLKNQGLAVKWLKGEI